MLPIVKKETLASFDKSNKPPAEIIANIDKTNPVLSMVLARYTSMCDNETQAFVLAGIALVYGLLDSQSEADELNLQWKE